MNEKTVTPNTNVPELSKKSTPVRKAVAGKTSLDVALKKNSKAVAGIEKKNKQIKKSAGKVKMVRDSFSMPQGDFDKITELKQSCLKDGLQVKKSELLRAGLHALSKMSAAQLRIAMTALKKIETNRAKKG